MKVIQSYPVINSLSRQFFGIREQVLNEDGTYKVDGNGQYVYKTTNPYEITETDTSNIVKLGKTLSDIMSTGDVNNIVDNYVKGLVSRIARIVFVDRVLDSTFLNMSKTSEQWGEIVEKVRFAIGDVKKDNKWSLKRGEQYPQDTYYPPEVSVKFFDGVDAFVYPISKTKDQIMSAFTGPVELNGFFNALEVSIANAMIIYLSTLELATLNTFIASLLSETTQPQRNVKLITEYKAENGITTLTPEAALNDVDFLQWMCARIDQDVQDMRVAGTFYNGTDKYPTFTPEDKQVCVMLSPVATKVKSIAKANTFNADFVNLPNYKTLPNWQGKKMTNSISLKAKSTINITNTQFGNLGTTENPSSNVTANYVIGVLFDYDAMGVNLYDRSVDVTPYNADGCFWTEYHRGKGRYYMDNTENGVVYSLT